MKLICSQKDLKNALLSVSRALPSKPQTPILNGIYFSARENILEMQATDFSIGIIAKIPAEIEVEGEIVINGKQITECISKLSGDIVNFEVVDQSAIIKSAASQRTLYTMEAEEFPKIQTQEYTHSFFIKNEILKDLINRSLFACAGEKDTRPIFKGCSVTITENVITFVATDTHRLVIIGGEIEDTISEEIKIIVPASALRDIFGILNNTHDERGVKVDFSDKHMACTVNNIFVTCRLIDGAFPPHEKLIPESFNTSVSVDVEDFLSAMSRVESVSRETEYDTMICRFSDEGLELSADSFTAGQVIEHLNAQIEGQPLNIAFKLGYVKDFLRFADKDSSVKISMNEPLSPAVFTLPEDTNITYVVTPIRTQ